VCRLRGEIDLFGSKLYCRVAFWLLIQYKRAVGLVLGQAPWCHRKDEERYKELYEEACGLSGKGKKRG
jgi:hypothetical protein